MRRWDDVMQKGRSNELALRRDAAKVPGSKIVFTPSDHQPRYSVDPSALGEFAIQWTADRFNGLFSVTDLPADWVVFIQNSIHGPWCEMKYDGAAPFSGVLWNSMPWEERVSEWVFSQVKLESGDFGNVGGVLGNVIDSIRDAEIKVAEEFPVRLPLHATLALPDRNTSTL